MGVDIIMGSFGFVLIIAIVRTFQKADRLSDKKFGARIVFFGVFLLLVIWYFISYSELL
jgi:hypothetical protein